jgi:drug/metabolite transporter (DMT)-like permease
VLGEPLTPAKAAGIAAVIAGVFLIAGGPALLRASHEPAARARVLAGLRWGAVTGVLIAGYTVIDGVAVKYLLLSPILVDYWCNVLRVPLLAPLVWRQRATLPTLWRAQWKPALVVATLGPIGYVLVLFAMQRAPISAVAPARELSLLFAALLGGTLLRERDVAARLAGGACIAAGVALLAAAGR